jgi:hypothetical protein
LKDFDVRLASEQFEHQAIDRLTINNVRVNGAAFTGR